MHAAGFVCVEKYQPRPRPGWLVKERACTALMSDCTGQDGSCAVPESQFVAKASGTRLSTKGNGAVQTGNRAHITMQYCTVQYSTVTAPHPAKAMADANVRSGVGLGSSYSTVELFMSRRTKGQKRSTGCNAPSCIADQWSIMLSNVVADPPVRSLVK